MKLLVLVFVLLVACVPQQKQKCMDGVVHYWSSAGWWVPMDSVKCVLGDAPDEGKG